MSYPNNVLSLGHGPAKHLPCGADDAYLEDLDWGAKNPSTECDAHVKAYYVQQMRVVGGEAWLKEDTFDWWYPSGVIEFSIAQLKDALRDVQAYHGGE